MVFIDQPKAKTPNRIMMRKGATSANSMPAPPDRSPANDQPLCLADTDHLQMADGGVVRIGTEAEGRIPGSRGLDLDEDRGQLRTTADGGRRHDGGSALVGSGHRYRRVSGLVVP